MHDVINRYSVTGYYLGHSWKTVLHDVLGD